MLLFRPVRGGKIPKKKLQERLGMFADGQWLRLLQLSEEVH